MSMTAALVNIFTRILDYNRFEWQAQAYGNLQDELERAASEWDALGQDANTLRNRNEIAQSVERRIVTEMKAWSQQLSGAAAGAADAAKQVIADAKKSLERVVNEVVQ